ncbi:MAG: hypothetical protein AABW63_02330 [Nanoarchaeota archaeon]
MTAFDDYKKYFELGRDYMLPQIERASWEGVAEVVAPEDLSGISLSGLIAGAESVLREKGFRLFNKKNNGSVFSYYDLGVQNA